MIEIQILPLKLLTAVLACIPIPLENIVPGELDLFFRQPVEEDQQDHLWHPNPERNRVDAFRMRLLL